jgi:hypothetical protein
VHNSTDKYYGVLVDTRFWNESPELALTFDKFVSEMKERLDPLKNSKQTVLSRLDSYQEMFREVLRRYTPYSKIKFEARGRNSTIRESVIDVYYPYMKTLPQFIPPSQERQDAFDLLNPSSLAGYIEGNSYLDSAAEKGVLNAENPDVIVISPEVQVRLSLEELLALRETRFARTFAGFAGLTPEEVILLDKSVRNKRDSALPLIPPRSNSPELTKAGSAAVAWWLYWRLTPAERQAWKRYCHNVNKAAEQIDEILRTRNVPR